MEPLAVLRNMLWFRHAEFLDADSIEALQKKKLGEIAKAASKTKYYRRLFKENSIRPSEIPENLDALPMTEKAHVRDNPELFIRSGLDMKSLSVMRTSGSTGMPTRVYQDRESQLYRHGVRYATDMSYGRSPAALYAHIYFSDFERNALLARTGLFPKLFLSVFDSEEKNIKMLRERRPNVVRSYPSVMSIIAKMNEVSDNPMKFKSVVCDSEVLTDEARKAMEESFSCPVYDHYGSMEASSVARECTDERSMHVESHSCIVEIVDGKGKPKKSGEGELVVTPLFNKAMPLLRYRIGDRASWGKECSCGRSTPVLKKMGGRNDDVIVLPSGRMRPGIAFYPVMSLTEIYSYQIIQERPDLLVFRYVPVEKDISDYLRKDLAKELRKACLGESISIEFERVSSIKRGRTGKINTIVSKIS